MRAAMQPASLISISLLSFLTATQSAFLRPSNLNCNQKALSVNRAQHSAVRDSLVYAVHLRGGVLKGWSDTEEEESGTDSEYDSADSDDADEENDSEQQKKEGSPKKKDEVTPAPKKSALQKSAVILKVAGVVMVAALVACLLVQGLRTGSLSNSLPYLIYLALVFWEKLQGRGSPAVGDQKRHFQFELMNYEYLKDFVAMAAAEKKAKSMFASAELQRAAGGIVGTDAASTAAANLKAVVAAAKAKRAEEHAELLASFAEKKSGLFSWFKNRKNGAKSGAKKGAKNGAKNRSTKNKNKEKGSKRSSRSRSESTKAQSDSDDAVSKEDAIVAESTGGDNCATADGTATGTVQTDQQVVQHPRVFVAELTDAEVSRNEGVHIEQLVTFLSAIADRPTDEVVLKVMSPGGAVATYGLAAAHLERLKQACGKVTVCIDIVAASGGYMLAVISHQIIAAPFSMVGSIGVRAGMLNFNKALTKYGVDSVSITAGEHKAGIDQFNEVTEAKLAHQKESIGAVQRAFKSHIKKHRPHIDVDKVGTGEVWLSCDAKDLGLVDVIGTAEEYAVSRMRAGADVYKVTRYVETIKLFGMRRTLMTRMNKYASLFKKVDKIMQMAEKALQSSVATSLSAPGDESTNVRAEHAHGHIAPQLRADAPNVSLTSDTLW